MAVQTKSIAEIVRNETWPAFNKRIEKLREQEKKIEQAALRNLTPKQLKAIAKHAKEQSDEIRAYYRTPKMQKAVAKAEKERLEREKLLSERKTRVRGLPGSSYKAGQSCPKMGKEHQFEDRGSYYKCKVCGSSKTKPRDLKSRVGKM